MTTQILNPEGCDPKDIKRTIIEENGFLKIVSTYPNGFVLTIERDSENNFKIIPSGEVIDLGNGVYQIPNW